MKKTIILIIVFLLLLTFSVLEADQPQIDVITVDGVINPVTADFITASIERATGDKAECLIIRLDTPGGLVDSTRLIIKGIMASKIPIVVFVSPSGARAASAGVFITLGSHVAVMAPSTNIGAAHPVTIDGGGDKDSVMGEKIENDLAAYIRTIANKTGRNAEWAEKAVRESVSITEQKALEEKIIDFIAKDMDDLIAKLDKRKIITAAGEKVIKAKNARVNHIEMTTPQKFFKVITDPNIAYLLMMIGMAGIFFELKSPGLIFPGIVGVISLILAFYALQTLPINYAGLFLILFAVLLFITELYVPSYGLLTTGGIISLVLGSMMLIDTPYPFLKVSLNVILPAALSIAAIFFFLVGAIVRAHSKKTTTGKEGLIGTTGSAETDIKKTGTVMVHGELWNAVSDEEINEKEKVKITGINGLLLKVEKLK
ncbi:MAG: serine protease [Candidatus Schekmanbacteria bacterium RIFCSPHIGHO2_02_FULL_38_11]|uniref:Serine protease n=1 Tax=Candidatus Schekmanbacteria bacterium RIFCSPLOWO2_12_FULL_38_15 TaxID=1817883 RepID=A0A1F7SH27_9BACT|nr:MAG: serine protease [Candidatus Schekmanbacteria bacterium RIFCSPHIGHO2_02_FULL_38_11]OGL50613.1 MAG: serine protease [Candidatus Schekmanbacteria bacterium RIFCSPLOWO2_02_FULL_38_14]OGL52477.1 MAG: serine protease [Candidatus Schekmanbacteria bacterium RIFCSPLOWO2_12_FULL_38_15]